MPTAPLLYTADTGYTGEDAFVYSVSDGALTDSATVTLNVQAILVNAGPSQTLLAGSATQLAGSIDPGDLSVSSIQWDFDYDGSNFVADTAGNGTLTPTYTWSNPGSYLVALQVTDTAGTIFQGLTSVLVKPADALLVQAGPDDTVTAGDSLTLSGSYTDLGSSVDTDNIAWDSNYDGQTFNPLITGTLTPTISYATAGTYDVALQVTDDAGNTDLSILQVTVNPISYIGPTADAGSDQTISAGSSTSFDGSYTDPDGSVSLANVAWDFNYDGSDFNPDVTDTLTPTLPTGVGPGTYTVAMQVTDSNGLSSLSTLQLTVSNVAPTVNAGSNLTVNAGSVVSFSGSYTDVESTDDQLSWDFNYDGVTFNGGAANTLTPQHVFTTAGTYTVALQVTNNYGDSGLGTLTVTVLPSSGLVVDAGPDQFLNEGDTAAFAVSWTDASGTVDPNSAEWDFNYDGSTFVADASASGTLTPSYTYNTPGLYQVAVQLTDSNSDTEMGLLYVTVSDVTPTVDAGDDQTVAQGSTVTFQGTACDPGGSGNPLQVAWDFDYDGSNFIADASANGSLTPSYVYTTPGTYLVALQVTDQDGLSDLESTVVTVTDVAPTATVSNSGTTAEGSPVTFTVSNLVDQTPGDTPTILADWDGSGQFEEITCDELTQNADGSLSFTHVYDAASGPNGYSAVIEIADSYGGATDYSQNVVITTAPTANFGPVGGSNLIDLSTPFAFTDVVDPSQTQQQDGFTYYVSIDGGAYQSTTASFLLPSDLSLGSHTVSGYVQSQDGAVSATMTWTGTVAAPQVSVINTGTGEMQLNWTDANGAEQEDADPGTTYTLDGTAADLTITLLCSGGNYQIATNGSIAWIGTGSNVSGVNLSVSTQVQSNVLSVGDGSIGEIDLTGISTLSLSARGDLGTIDGAVDSGSDSGPTASNLVFANLDGSINGLQSITNLTASGWLGEDEQQEVNVFSGIANLSAYGIGATVNADLNANAGDAPMTLNVGGGGIPGVLNAGNVASAQIGGWFNVLTMALLQGPVQAQGGEVFKAEQFTDPTAPLNFKRDVKSFLLTGVGVENKAKSITVDGKVASFVVRSSLTVTGNIDATSFGTINVSGSLKAANLIASTGGIDLLDVNAGLTLTGDLRARGTIGAILVRSFDFKVKNINVGNITSLTVTTGNLTVSGTINVDNLTTLTVGKNLSARASPWMQSARPSQSAAT